MLDVGTTQSAVVINAVGSLETAVVADTVTDEASVGAQYATAICLANPAQVAEFIRSVFSNQH